MLSADAIFTSSSNEREQATSARRTFLHKSGDHMTLLNLYKCYMANRINSKWCVDNFIDPRAMKHVCDVRNQLVHFCDKHGLSMESCGEDPQIISRCLVSGHFLQCAFKQPDGGLKSVMGRQVVHIHPSSVLHGTKPDCVIYHELVHFTKKC